MRTLQPNVECTDALLRGPERRALLRAAGMELLNMRKTLPLLIIACFSSLASCSPSRQSDLESAASPISSSIQYEGESTMRVYQVIMDMETLKPLSARFDMEFTAKNGEPIADLDRHNELESQLKPDRSNLIGDGLYIYHCFYYDLDCRVFVGLDDIAVENLNLFYYLT